MFTKKIISLGLILCLLHTLPSNGMQTMPFGTAMPATVSLKTACFFAIGGLMVGTLFTFCYCRKIYKDITTLENKGNDLDRRVKSLKSYVDTMPTKINSSDKTEVANAENQSDSLNSYFNAVQKLVPIYNSLDPKLHHSQITLNTHDEAIDFLKNDMSTTFQCLLRASNEIVNLAEYCGCKV